MAAQWMTLNMKAEQLREKFPYAPESFIQRNADDGKIAFIPIPEKTPPRTNRSNDGRSFQNEIIQTASAYRSLGVLKIEKADPPVKSIGKKMIRLENPFPDFVGVLCFNKRMLAIEAKSTSEHRLPVNRDGGLTKNQCDLLRDWHKAGAIAGVLWKFEGNVEWIHWPFIEQIVQAGMKSLRFGGGVLISRGNGFVTWDFAKILQRIP